MLLCSVLTSGVAIRVYVGRVKTITQLQSKLAVSADRIRESDAKLSQLETESEEELAGLAGQNAALQTQLERVMTGIWQEEWAQESSQRIHDLTGQIAEVTAERDAALRKAKTTTEGQNGLQVRLDELLESVAASRREGTDLHRQVDGLNSRIVAVSFERDSIRDQLVTADRQRDGLRIQVRDLTTKLVAATQPSDRSSRFASPSPTTGNMTWTRWSRFLAQYQKQRGTMTLAEVRAALGDPDKKLTDDNWVYLDANGMNYQVTFAKMVRGVNPIKP